MLIYYVPPCPKCKSKNTGKLVPYSKALNNRYLAKQLSKGQLVSFSLNGQYNAFCNECGIRWYSFDSGYKWISLKQYIGRIKQMHITYEDICQLKYGTDSYIEYSEQQKALKKRKKHSKFQKSNSITKMLLKNILVNPIDRIKKFY